MLGAVLAVCAEPLRKWLFKPKLSMSFNEAESCVVQAVTAMESGQIVSSACYVRVQVHNRGRRTTKNCRPFLARIERLGHGTSKTVHQDALPLNWSFTGQRPMDVPPGMYFHVDVLEATEEHAHFVPCVKPIPKFWAGELSVPGTYRLTIMLSAEDIQPKVLSLLVTWTGKPEQLLVRAG